jgi:hypothetical protein
MLLRPRRNGKVRCGLGSARVRTGLPSFTDTKANAEAVSDTEFEVGQTVFVNKGDQGGAVPNWIARILEIRAGDTRHVFLRVYWMYRPEDIPEGRQPYHGENELIASNGMDIIDALTVNDHADVIYWDENPDSDNWPAKDQLFWRQTLDLGKPKAQQLSVRTTHALARSPLANLSTGAPYVLRR